MTNTPETTNETEQNIKFPVKLPKLKKNGWQRKIQLYIFPKSPLYNSWCPFFWLTNVSIILSPFVTIYKIAKWIFISLIVSNLVKLSDVFNKYICVPMYSSFIKDMDKEEVIESWLARYYYEHDRFDNNTRSEFDYLQYKFKINPYKTNKFDKLNSRFETWKKLFPDTWEEKLKEYRQNLITENNKRVTEKEAADKLRFEKQQQLEVQRKDKLAKDAEIIKKRKQFYAKLVTKSKYPIYTIAGAIATFALYWLVRLFIIIGHAIGILCSKIHWHEVLIDSVAILIIATFVVLIYALVTFIIKLCKKCDLFPDLSKKWYIRIIPTFLTTALAIIFGWAPHYKSDTVIIVLLTLIFSIVSVILFCIFIVQYDELCKRIDDFFTPIGKKIAAFFIGIGTGFKTVFYFLKATKDNYCPAIEWEEDTKEEIKQ